MFALAMMLGLAAATTGRAATGNDNWIGGVGDNNWSSAGNWTGANTPPAAGDTLVFGLQGAGGLTLNNDLTIDTSFYGLTFNASAPAFILGGNEIISTNAIVDNSLNLETVNLPIVFPVTNNVTAASGATLVLGGVISGAGGLTANGLGTVTLTNVNTYAGATAVNAGMLKLDFTAGGVAANIVSNTSALKLGGGTLNVVGVSGSTAQTVNGATFNAGASAISASGSATLTIGAMTPVLGGSVVFNGPATTTYSGGNSVTPTTVPATATITTTTVGAGSLGLVVNSTTPATVGAYATVGLYDWASTDVAGGTAGASPYTIIGGSQVTGFYNTTTFAGNNFDVPAAGFALASGTQSGQTLRFNAPSATPYTPTIVSNPHGDNVAILGILVTPNMGAQNAGISGNTWSPYYGGTAGRTNTLQIWQNNTLGFFNCAAIFYNGRGSTPSINGFVQNGPGTVVYSSANTETYSTWLNGGCSVVGADSAFGVPSSAAVVYLDGGTIVATNSFTMDNLGANKRPITLLANGGGLAAAAGTTLTVDGQIGSAAGTAPLVIGIPASAANGNVAGLLPGSGPGTANTTPVYGTGTVVLNYANNTAGNYQFGGTIITGGATLNINSEYDLGGVDQGPTIFNCGTLQYNSTLALGTAGTVLDISVQPVSFAGNGTIDYNGQTVTYANSIGNGSSGSLTVANSGSSGVGGLYLNGGSTHTGGTIVAGGAVLGSTATMAGNVTWTANSYAALSVSSPMTLSGSVTMTNPTVNVVASGLTTGVYTLLTATGGITSGSTVNSTPGGIGVIASGYAGTVSISGNSVILTVVQLGVAATWTDGNADQNWSEGGNWTGGTAPHSAGDAATFGSGGVGLPVNLNVNETVGGISFSNASSYTIIGANTLTLDNTAHGIPITVTAGTSNAINTAVALNGNVSATVGAGDSLTIGGSIANQSTPETLTVTGGGTLALTNANTYGPAAGMVGTTINGATLQLGNSGSLGSGDVNVTANSTLQPLVTGLNIANNIAVASSHTITANNNGGAVALSGVISGNGSVAASGAGSVILSGVNNTYTGSTVISSGVLSIAMDGASVGNTASLGVVPAAATPNNIIFTGGDLLATATMSLNANRGVGIGATSGSTGLSTAFIDVASGQTLTIPGIIASAGNFGTNSLTVNSGAGNTGTLLLTAANTFNGTNTLVAGAETLGNSLALQNSTLNYIGGTFSFGTLTSATLGGLAGTQNLALDNTTPAAVALTVGNNGMNAVYTGTLSGDGSLNKTGAGSQTIGSSTGGGASYTGAMVIDNGVLTLDGNGSVSMSTTNNVLLSGAQGASTLNLVDSAQVTTSGGVYLGSEPTGGSDGGNGYPAACTLTVQNNAQLIAATLSYGGVGVSTRVPNCTVTVANSGLINVAGAFQLGNIAGSAAPSGAVNVNGGTLAVGNFIFSAASATRPMAINLNGGVLKANASDPSGSTFLPVFADTTVNVTTNGANINPNGNSITIAAVLAHSSGTPDGGLKVSGSGTLTLSGVNTYTGSTIVSNATLVVSSATAATGPTIVSSNGTLVVNGSTAGSGVTVLTNGTLGGSGTIGDPTITIENGGHTLPGGTLGNTTGVNMPVSSTLTYNTGAEADFNVGTTYNSGNDQMTVIGTLIGTAINVGVNFTGGAGNNMDLTSPYVICTVPGTLSATFNPTPVWIGTPPANSNLFNVVIIGNTVVLSGSPIHILSATATPNPVSRGQLVTFTVNVTAGSYTIDPNTGIQLNAGNINGPSSLYLVESNSSSIYTNSTIVSSGTAIGSYPLSYTISDSNGDTINPTITVNVTGALEVWDGNASPDNTWSNALNWANDTVPLPGDFVTFGGTQQLTPDMETSYSIGSLTFASTAGGFNITNSASTLTLTGGVTNNSVNSEALSVGVSLIGNPTFNTAAGDIVISNQVSDDSKGFVKTGSYTLKLEAANNYNGPITVNGGTLSLDGDNSNAGSSSVTNNATLRLANANALAASALTLNSGSTLKLRADGPTTFQMSSLALQNASDTLNFDVSNLTAGVTGQTLTLSSTLAFANSSSQTINVTGNSTYTLSLGAITLTSGSHNPLFNLFVNTSPTGPAVMIASVTFGNWGNDLDFNGGGNVTVTGNLTSTSNGSIDLFVNNGTTATLQGISTGNNAASDGNKCEVANGTLVLDNDNAVINDTHGAGLGSSLFILGAATNTFSGTGYTQPASALTASNNSFNAAIYLGDAANPGGGLITPVTLTNYVSDGDVGFTNSGVFTIGGQNTGGSPNVYANPIILGWTTNRGKSVTLVAATGGEVDFANILANGTDQTAGVTVNDATHAGLVKFTGVNTYGGNTTINGGTLEVANANFSTNSNITITNGALLQLDFASTVTNNVNALILNGVSQPAGVYNYSTTPAYFTIASTGNLKVVPVPPQTPVLQTAPTASAIVFGQTLASSTLSGGSVTNAAGATVSGSFAFTSPSTAPGAGTSSQPVKFTPADTAHYNSLTFNVNVTVAKATPVLQAAPTATAITYGQTLSASTLSGGAVTNATGGSVAGSGGVNGFAFTTPSTAPNAGTAAQPVTFTPADAADYNSITLNINVTVNPQVPVLQAPPAATTITNGQPLSASILSGGSVTNAADAIVTGSGGVNGFAFTTPSATPGVGTANQSVTFTPADNVDYTPITLNVSVTVVAQQSVTGLMFTAKPVVSGTSLTISGTNTGAGTFYLLDSTNVAAHLNTWTPLWTNTVGGSSSFTTNLSNAVNPAQKHNFYILSTTNNQ